MLASRPGLGHETIQDRFLRVLVWA